MSKSKNLSSRLGDSGVFSRVDSGKVPGAGYVFQPSQPRRNLPYNRKSRRITSLQLYQR